MNSPRTWVNSEDSSKKLFIVIVKYGRRDIQSKILQRVYNRSTAEEQRWIVRIILKGQLTGIIILYCKSLKLFQT